jgi:chemotaxis-related protein WspD
MTNDCWNKIGVRGDGSCPELVKHVHCRNCPVYFAAARALLDRELSAADLAERTTRVARAKPANEQSTQSVLIFRMAAEWFALPTSAVTEVADVRPIHSLPHRRGGAVMGVASVRGELVVCVSLVRLLGLERAAALDQRGQRLVHPRLLVLRRDLIRALCPADEVHGTHRLNPADLQEVPSTVGKASGRISRAIIPWRGHSVGLLDEHLLFQNLQRCLA